MAQTFMIWFMLVVAKVELTRYSEQATGWKVVEDGFGSRQGESNFFYSTASGLAQGPIQLRIQFVSGALSLK
jgi:hypothetical protein